MADMKFYSANPAVEESVSQVTATPSVGLGTRRYHAGEEYVYCYNAGGAQASVNLGVKFVTGASGYSIAQTSITDVFNPCVGVVKHSTMAAGDYGWVMTRGFASVKLVSASTADYKMIALGAAGSFIEASGTTTFGTATVVGHLLSHNTGAGGTAYAFIKGLV
jgi:hypothetical protein